MELEMENVSALDQSINPKSSVEFQETKFASGKYHDGDSVDDDEERNRASGAQPKFANAEEYHAAMQKQFYISLPWSPQVYFTVRGAENLHIYLWIAKDLAWTQDAYYPAWIFGVGAMSWTVVLVYHAAVDRCWEELYMLVPLIMWLAGNFVWMAGEVFRDDDDVGGSDAGTIMETAIALILLYHLCLRPLGFLPADAPMSEKYNEAGLHPRFSYFKNWRQYEHAHTLCWLGKDLSWNRYNPYTWVLCTIPTLLIAADFIYVTWSTKKMAIDTAHYIAQLIWVIGNLTWAMGEIFTLGDNDDPYFIFHDTALSRDNLRWYAAWFLFSAYAPIALLYFVWLPLTCMGRIKAADIPENNFIDSQDQEQQQQQQQHFSSSTSKRSIHVVLKGGIGDAGMSPLATSSPTNNKDEKYIRAPGAAAGDGGTADGGIVGVIDNDVTGCMRRERGESGDEEETKAPTDAGASVNPMHRDSSRV